MKLRIQGYVTRLFENSASSQIHGPISFCDWLYSSRSFCSNCKEKKKRFNIPKWTASHERHLNGGVHINFICLRFYNVQPKHATRVFLYLTPIWQVQKYIPFRCLLIYGNSQKLHGAMSEEWAWWTTEILLCIKNYTHVTCTNRGITLFWLPGLRVLLAKSSGQILQLPASYTNRI